MNIRFAVLLLIPVIGLAACGGEPSEGAAMEASPDTFEPLEEQSEVKVEEETSMAVYLGAPEIELLTPVSGGGTRPILEWAAVEGAIHYTVWVRTPQEKPYWSWLTSDTSVPVGGLPRLNEDAGGPSIVGGMTWSVTAHDADGSVIAASNHRPISP